MEKPREDGVFSLEGIMKLLEEKLGYTFRDRNLLLHALTHSSYAVSYTHLTLPTMAVV